MDIESSAIAVQLGSVSVNGGPFGIKLNGSAGTFAILGGNAYGTGGTIQNTTIAGVLINSFGDTGLNWVDFVNNASGIQSTGSHILGLAGLRINGSTGYAVDSMNDIGFSLSNSFVQNNGSVGGGSIRVQANVVNTYVWHVVSNTIADPNGTAVQFNGLAGSAGSTLTSQITGNVITANNSGSTVIAMNWNGPETATVGSNTITANASNMTAIQLQDTSSADILTASVGGNVIVFSGAGATSGTGIWVIDGKSGSTSTVLSSLSVASNSINFQGTGGTGFRFGSYNETTNSIVGNTITDQAGGGTGMQFDYVAANSTIGITGNTITLLAGSPLQQTGIIFNQVAPMIGLTPPGYANFNFINNASAQRIVIIPKGTANGGIFANGTFFSNP
jgi:hypothetical protein